MDVKQFTESQTYTRIFKNKGIRE